MTTYQVVPTELKKYKFSENAFLPKIVTVPLTQEKKCECRALVSAGLCMPGSEEAGHRKTDPVPFRSADRGGT